MITPCIKICVIAPEPGPLGGLCTGCGRTLGEIAAWSGYAESERQSIMDALPTRLAALRPTGEPCAEERTMAEGLAAG